MEIGLTKSIKNKFMANNPHGKITLSAKTEVEMLEFVQALANTDKISVDSVENFVEKINALSKKHGDVLLVIDGMDILGVEMVSPTSISLFVRTLWIDGMLGWSDKIVKEYPYLSLSGSSSDCYMGYNFDFNDTRVLQVLDELNIHGVGSSRPIVYLSETDPNDKKESSNKTESTINRSYTFSIIANDESTLLEFCKDIATADGMGEVSSAQELVEKLNVLIDGDPQKKIKSNIINGCYLSYVSCLSNNTIEVKFDSNDEDVHIWSSLLLNKYLSLSLSGSAPNMSHNRRNNLTFETTKRISIHEEEIKSKDDITIEGDDVLTLMKDVCLDNGIAIDESLSLESIVDKLNHLTEGNKEIKSSKAFPDDAQVEKLCYLSPTMIKIDFLGHFEYGFEIFSEYIKERYPSLTVVGDYYNNDILSESEESSMEESQSANDDNSSYLDSLPF